MKKNDYDVEYVEDGGLPYIEQYTVWDTIKDLKYFLSFALVCFALVFVAYINQ